MKYLGKEVEGAFVPSEPMEEMPQGAIGAELIKEGYEIKEIELDENNKLFDFYKADGTRDNQAEQEQEQISFRTKRDELLSALDKYQLVARYNELTFKQKSEFKKYRRALLDSTQEWTLPKTPEWVK